MGSSFELQDAMESTESGPAVDRLLDSVYLRSGGGPRRAQHSVNFAISQLQSTQGSFHLSQVQNITSFRVKDRAQTLE